MKVTSTTVGIPVSDVETTRRWYERIFELEPDVEPAEGIYEYELSPGSWLQLFQGASGSSEHIFRLGVEDVDGERDRLLRLGVSVHEIERIEGVIAFCEFADPVGNR